MLLCIDIGNSNIVLGLSENDKIIDTYRLVTNANLTDDEYAQKIKSLIDISKIDGVIISNVVPALDIVFSNMVKKYFHLKPLFIGPGVKSGLKLKIENPKSLGADLLCDAVGSIHKYGAPCIIVDLGTATKILVVNEKSEYLGGIIAPGIKGALNSLIASAAKLSHASLDMPDHIVCNDTTSCIQSGMVYGTAAMIDGLLSRMISELEFNKVKIILTGGLASIIKPALLTEVIDDPNILIEGLIVLYNKNK